MSYYTFNKEVKESVEKKTVAIATYEGGAEIIAKALNFYFGDNYTRNESVEMMHSNTASALKIIAKSVEKWGIDKDEIIEYLIEVADEMEAQSLVVAMRDELKFDKPKD
ncbi:MAG TPA: hypothetical protein PK431_10730 [Chitinophagales bacterium]|nr:hypothetical protein [Chitinophagales bacterium]